MRSYGDKERKNYIINGKKQRCSRELGDTRLFINEKFEEYAVGNKIRNSEKEKSHLYIVHFYFCKSVIVTRTLHWDQRLVLRSDYGNAKWIAVQDWVNDLKICWAVAAWLFKVKVRLLEIERRLCKSWFSQDYCKQLPHDFVTSLWWTRLSCFQMRSLRNEFNLFSNSLK